MIQKSGTGLIKKKNENKKYTFNWYVESCGLDLASCIVLRPGYSFFSIQYDSIIN